MKRNTKKMKEEVEQEPDSKPCMCDTHIKMDALRKDPIPCIGHGKGCPCTEKLEAEKQNDGTKENVQTISESEQQT